jgi:hypothetical protein
MMCVNDSHFVTVVTIFIVFSVKCVEDEEVVALSSILYNMAQTGGSTKVKEAME